jgi:hypothetical protein
MAKESPQGMFVEEKIAIRHIVEGKAFFFLLNPLLK